MTTKPPVMDELESTCLRSAVNYGNQKKDLHDMIEEIKNLQLVARELKTEIEDDLCQIVGGNAERFAEEYYQKLQKEKAKAHKSTQTDNTVEK